MPNDLLKATGGTLDIGVDEFTSDYSAEINLDFESQNLTSGVYRGIGPRVGMQTLPGHADNEALATNACNNMRQSEGSYTTQRARSIYRRYNIYNIFPIKLASYSNIDVEETVYAWLISSQGRVNGGIFSPGSTNLSLVLNCTYEPYVANPIPQQFPYSADFRDGFHVSQGYGMSASGGGVYQDTGAWLWNAVNLLVQSSGNAGTTTKFKGTNTLLTIAEDTFFVSAISVSFSGRNVPMQFLVGDTGGTTVDAGTVPKINFWKFKGDSGQSYPVAYSNGCVASSLQTGNYKTTSRNFKIYSFGAQTFANVPNEFVCAHNVLCRDVDLAFSPVWNYRDASGSNYHVNFTDAGTNSVTLLEGPVGAYNTVQTALFEDDEGFTNTAFRAVLAAPGKAVAWIIQDWLRSPEGMLPQVVDLANHAFIPPVAIAGTPSASQYNENGIPVATSFGSWPDYVSNTPLAAAYGVSLTTAANSGIFRANSTYELGYSYYNKRLDFETNVGKPVKFRTGATDFVGLQLTNTTGALRAATPKYTQSELQGILFWEFGPFLGQQTPSQLNLEINSTEIRFYYRRFGSFEWLPILFIDAAKWWFYPFFIDPAVAGTGLIIGETPIAGLPGGQPGGFIDNSRLPDLSYNCVLSFQDRIWWFSTQSVHFSPRNNMFVYPAVNSISCRTGNFEGGMVHNFPGQAQQSSRLLIFGTKEVYVARFTGYLSTAPVQVSDTTIGEYPVDASDLVIDTWTTNTAFSFRAAIVAEGIAYWWGPNGVYRDNGVDTPKKISLRLEPRIYQIYDPSDASNIHCSYDETLKEITWYYRPKNAADNETKGITWNLIDEEWLPQTYAGIIDSVFSLKIQTNMDNAGPRNIMVSRALRDDVVSRAYFYDARAHGCADIYPTKDFVVKEISTPVTGQRRLTLAAGYDATNFGTIAAGNLISLLKVTSYAPTILCPFDMVCKVVAVGAGYIDIRLPSGGGLESAAVLTPDTYFPIYQKTLSGEGLNGFTWRIKTKYFMYFGINFFGNWLWLYIMHKLGQVKSDDAETYSIGYRSPTSGDFVYDAVVYKDNSDGYWQLYHALRTAYTNNQGQALKLDMTGVQIASPLVLQFLELHATEQTGNDLKQFEG
jgi:hypothetical protein